MDREELSNEESPKDGSKLRELLLEDLVHADEILNELNEHDPFPFDWDGVVELSELTDIQLWWLHTMATHAMHV